ncbi:IS3 family transposase [Oceanispirochaeta crateris]|uniref:IS3 family transposase n=1 Tax=Oceanispirochaeta crateris TaxID=2518645 RepID=A0A5C1QPQ1_9SPIO|nr:IS3 family transposase [Oceanispirochaeta crateris]QEN09000.1 IS3 family transposase [Oceanispirochaeta crateris]QEN09176.1 IS3 family transposase [Oceanispirochaeta crateris]
MGGRRGRLITQDLRDLAVSLLDEAISDGARRSEACNVMDISVRTYHRWSDSSCGDKRKGAVKKVKRKLAEYERQEILRIACEDRFVDCNPYQIVVTLLDEGVYIASVSTFYRVLRDADMIHHRKRSYPARKQNKPPELAATGPNQVWSWDITFLKTDVNGIFLYCYMIVDVWSRKIVGWEIHESESSELAEQMFRRLKIIHKLEGIRLHSDNGNPMKGGTMIMTLYALGVIPSFSRPRVSDDNPYSESLFKTLKYTAGYPKYFKDIHQARVWMADFVNWYNNEHKHSGISYISPAQRHCGDGSEIMEKRNKVIRKAISKTPERWSSDQKIWEDQKHVYLNPSLETKKQLISA